MVNETAFYAISFCYKANDTPTANIVGVSLSKWKDDKDNIDILLLQLAW